MDFFEVPKFMLQQARARNLKALSILKECLEKDDWPTKQPTLKLLEYPRWFKPNLDDQPAKPALPDEFVPLF
jgi:hypothetical protein